LADFDIYSKLNPGIYISERDLSVFNVTQFYNQITLVLGCSKEGPFNVPIINISPDNFEKKFGMQDYALERKGSYFHRTVKALLQEGPVLTVNLRTTDRELDKYNWINLSTSSDNYNSNTRTNPIEDFYNIADGFWRKNVDQLIGLADDNIPDSNKNPFNIVNQSAKPVSILAFKSKIKGFDITVEDWYNSKTIPQYLHPKDLISDYLIDVYAIQGRWNNYEKLALDIKWSKYFNKNGFKRETLDAFIGEAEVVLVNKWTGSVLPYFKDKAGRDMYIQSIINNDVDETGIWTAYNSDIIETDYRNGLVDILGDNLSANKKPKIDFLSYKKNLTDLYLVEEKLLDQPGNSFGNPEFVLGGREQYNSEGYVYGCKLKNIIVNTTNTLKVKPLDCFYDDAYGIINGKKIELNNDINYDLVLQEILTPGNKIIFAVILTENGISFKIGNMIPNSYTSILPLVDYHTEIVLGYYIISQDLLGYETENYNVQLFGNVIDAVGFVNPFTKNLNSKITLRNTNYIWQQELVFYNINNYSSQDYQQLRIYHLWYWLSKNLKEKESLYIDIDGKKQLVEFVEQYNESNNKVIKISIQNKDSNIRDTDGTAGTSGLLSIYMEDLEFLSQKEIEWIEKIEPFVDGSNGIIGDDSFIYDSFVKGEINSGDPFFKSIGEEDNVVFYTDYINNYIMLKDGPNANYVGSKVIVYGSTKNDGIFTILNSTYIGGEFVLYVKEDITPETVDKLRIYDAENPKIVNLYFIGGKMKAKVEDYNGDSEELYRRVFGKIDRSQWKKTLEIEQVIDSNRILVSAQTYGKLLNYNYYLLANNKSLTDDTNEVKRNWTRIVDLVRWADDESLMLVETDAPIAMKTFDGDLQTEYLIPIDEWVDTLDFKVLEPFIVREESLPNGTEERQNQILNLISKDTKMAKSLCVDRMEWRYLVDSFGLGLTSNSKYQLAELCSNKQLAMGFLNMPSIKQFRMSEKTLFTKDGSFDTKLLLTGGDRRNSAGVRYSLTEVGKSYVMYITPYVVVSERGRKFEVPPSPSIAQLYMKKHNNTKVFQPWTIMAGVPNRITQIAGLEELFSPEQLSDLHRLRVTPITNFQNIIFYPFAENTSEIINSSLGYAHNREALIELEIVLKQELNNFQWDFYTKENAKRIVDIANSICGNFKIVNAIAEYRNYFDFDPELIDAQIAVLNTYIEPVAGMGSIVIRINILKTKGLEGI